MAAEHHHPTSTPNHPLLAIFSKKQDNKTKATMSPIRDGSPPPPGFPPEAETGRFAIVIKKQRASHSPTRSSSSSFSFSSIRSGRSGRSGSSYSSFFQKIQSKTKTKKKKRDESLLKDDITGYKSKVKVAGKRSWRKSGSGNPYENWSRESPSLENILRVFPGNALSDEEDEEGEM